MRTLATLSPATRAAVLGLLPRDALGAPVRGGDRRVYRLVARPTVGAGLGVGVGVGDRLRAAVEGRRGCVMPAGAVGAAGVGVGVGVGVGAKRAGPQCYNLRVLMNHCDPDMQERTVDRDDRAHQVRDAGGLVPARLVVNARPRRYHPSQMVGPAGGRVSLDTAAERLDVAMRRLDLGRAPSMARAVREGLAVAAARVGPASLRDVLEPRTRSAMTPAELRLEKRASDLLRRSGRG